MILRFYTPAEVADLLKLGRNTVYRMLESGELPAVKPRGQWRVSETDLISFLETTRPEQRTRAYTCPQPRPRRRKGRTGIADRARLISEGKAAG